MAQTAVSADRVAASADRSQPVPTTPRQSGHTTWALGRRQWLLLLMSYIGFVVVGTGVGWLLKGPLDSTAVVRTDRSVANWFVDHRTPNLNRYTVWGSDLADTFIKIGATAVLALVLWILWRRWLVQRPRPDVDRLEGSPVDSSFPSGHVAAATAYAALAVIVYLHTRNRWARISVVSLCAAVTAVVGLSRMYRGMHFLSDVVAGVLLGAASVAISTAILLHTPQGRALTRMGDTAKVDTETIATDADGGA